MLRSMTGFGKSEAENSKARIYIEIKAVNHKYFDLMNKLPLGFLSFEDGIKTALQKHISRGRINLFLDYEDLSGKNSSAQINMKTARRYTKLLKGVKTSLGLSDEVTLQQLMSMPGVLTYGSGKPDAKQLWPLIKKVLDDAVKQLLASKEEEGKALRKQLAGICEKIEGSLKIIKHHSAGRKKEHKKKLTAMIKGATKSDRIINRQKLEEEVAIFARNSDIAEETCRIDAHTKAFKRVLFNHKEVGRRLDFIAQEISREANTIGAKANNVQIAGEVIKIKSHIEKIREQTQNVE
ncbi:MAG: YicC/YloC family endoribonuclease [Candidatus Omnitrophota bacterium]